MKKISLLAGMIFSLVNVSHASESNINFSGTLTKGGCLINNGQAIDVDFGDITGNLRSIATNLSSRFQKEITYTVSCSGGIQNNALKIKIDGSKASGTSVTTTSADYSVLATSKNDLGIMLAKSASEYVRDNSIQLGQWYNFEYPNLMKIFATPVAIDSPGGVIGTVSGGEFTASATMQIEYQ